MFRLRLQDYTCTRCTYEYIEHTCVYEHNTSNTSRYAKSARKEISFQCRISKIAFYFVAENFRARLFILILT